VPARPAPPAKIRLPFFIVLGSLFLGLVLGVSGLLSWYHHRQTSALILDETREQYRKTARIIAGSIAQSIDSVRQIVTLLSATRFSFPATETEQRALLSQFVTALKIEPHITGLQIGFTNGEYFIVRPFRAPEQRRRFQAPDSALFGVDIISRSPQGAQLTRLFFDRRLKEIGRRSPVHTTYDPRNRPWYRQAVQSGKTSISPIYLFFFAREVGATISRKDSGHDAVIAADITLDNLSDQLARYQPTRSSEIIIFNREHQVLAYPRRDLVVRAQGPDSFRLTTLAELNTPPLTVLGDRRLFRPGPLLFAVGNEEWIGAIDPIPISDDRKVYLLVTSPKSELLAGINAIRRQSMLLGLAIILLSIPLALAVAHTISRKLHGLAREAKAISGFDFSGDLTTLSSIRELAELTRAMDMLKSTLSRFLHLIRLLAEEQDFTALLRTITEETMTVSRADGVVILLTGEGQKGLHPAHSCQQDRSGQNPGRTPADPGAMSFLDPFLGQTTSSLFSLEHGTAESGRYFLDWLGAKQATLLILPLNNRQGEPIGLLVTAFCGTKRNDTRLDAFHIAFLEQFSGFAAVSLESRRLLQKQKHLLESFIELLAGAIDAKSAYTGGHCQRVPVITEMLARAACADASGPFRDFTLDDQQWEELHIAAWLHDCGKITTPEYVVDKATKLETIYNRIHEIRTRFEVLKRDAHLDYYTKLLAGGEESALRAALEQEWRQLDEEFAFVARCNEGTEHLGPEERKRLEKIAARTWTRTLDDGLGISWEEKQRRGKHPSPRPPAIEPLLADRPEHRIPRPTNQQIGPDNPWGFHLDVPELLYNRGELHNLLVEQGTLTPEERFKINDHIVQTIIMLEHLPFPSHLEQVPAIAGGHHESMNGKGYPRRLTGAQLPLTARMMMIADIFEALTAADRPYKKAKTLSESLLIMARMARDGHIDPELFRLFLDHEVYLEYARDYLRPEQSDRVEKDRILAEMAHLPRRHEAETS